MGFSFTDRVFVPPDVFMREIDGESVLLNLKNECYYGLDEVGTRMLTLLSTSESIDDAFKSLVAEYDVEPEVLERDFRELIDKLMSKGLLEIGGE